MNYEATDGCDGYCDRANRRIGVAAALPPNAQVRILIHECCHAHGADYETYDRAACEVIVDCATHIACATIGLDVSGETIPYITGWGDAHGALAAVTTFAGVIDDLSARIETVLTPSASEAVESPLAAAPGR